MKYSIVIHHESGSAYGVTVPDIPGCYSADDTYEEAFENAVEAIQGHIGLLVEDGADIPQPQAVASHLSNADYADGVWGFVDIDTTKFILPEMLIHKIDDFVSSHKQYKSRSGFLATVAMDRMAKS